MPAPAPAPPRVEDALTPLLARAVAERPPPATALMQRAVEVRTRTYSGGGDFKDFANKLRQTLSRRGYNYPNRLNIIISLALDAHPDLRVKADQSEAAKLIKGMDFDSFDHLVDYLAENELIVARLPVGKPSRLRARKLGQRPAWISSLTKLRADHAGEAARHVIPSHFLGWVAEQWKPSDAQYDAWIKQAELIAPHATEVRRIAHTGVLARKRRVWEILHNHPGNLWWGHNANNTVIGFIAPYLERLLHHLDELKDEDGFDLDAMRAKVEEGLPGLGDNAGVLGERWREVAETLHFLYDESAGVTMGDVRNAVEDAFLQTELDPRELLEWKAAVALYDEMRNIANDPAGEVMLKFLSTNFTGTIGSYGPTPQAADQGASDTGAMEIETESRGTKRKADAQKPAKKKPRLENVTA